MTVRVDQAIPSYWIWTVEVDAELSLKNLKSNAVKLRAATSHALLQKVSADVSPKTAPCADFKADRVCNLDQTLPWKCFMPGGVIFPASLHLLKKHEKAIVKEFL